MPPPVRIGPRTVLAYHLVWTAYGWWLPNDPRGSMSTVIASDVIAELGSLHYGRKRVQPASRDIRSFYERAKELLKFPLLAFAPAEVAIIAAAFDAAVARCGYTCYACVIMPDHVHVLIRKHRGLAERMIENLQQASKVSVRKSGLRHWDHPVWGGPGWKVFLDSPEDIERTIKYIVDNPRKAHLPGQQWDFVTKYDGWSFRKSGK